ncbi:MAG TPA: spore germination protein GerW family protein [Bacillota bacterium]|jgi:uncharacterized spore protein YtfJ|nr:spore germination protein GerW family protein [Bacillota bacterium]HOL12106.1 spore germination protein GerW family protein [Bacillota bacterium]HOQ03546.1 spore germination protein GerW family protein [Bacillota bacterium]HPP60979.1 spore germination protein GerW family protein [Bacillota bacterium]HPV13967.1 spore germination protein GerW family protein [Bacillota bacterium]
MERVGVVEEIASELEKFLSTETIFGDPMVIHNVTLIPVQSVCLGFGGGTGVGKAVKTEGQGTGSGAGAILKPIAMVAIKEDGQVEVYSFKGVSSVIEKVAEQIPEIVSKVVKVAGESGIWEKKPEEVIEKEVEVEVEEEVEEE